MAAGLDSLGAVELRNTLESSLGMQLPGTLVFDYPSVAMMSQFLGLKVSEGDSVAAVVDVPVSLVSGVEAGPSGPMMLSVGDFVASSDSLSEDLIRPVSLGRWEVASNYQISLLRYLENLHEFDSKMFSISNSETLHLDPQQRLLLEQMSRFIASIDRKEDAGVFVGIATGDYTDMILSHDSISAFTATGSAISAASGRLSYTFGLNGPSLSVDTACSASLVALNLATYPLKQRSIQSGTVCAAKCILTPLTSLMFQAASMLAPDFRCKTMDQSANGFVRGEASVGIFLHTGEQDTATSNVVVCGTAVNQDGRSSSLTAPNGPAQQGVMRAAVRQAGGTTVVHSLQMHGTGTALGDPIEVGATSAVLGTQDSTLVLSAGKTCIGHTEPAAGISGIVHAMTAMSSATAHPLLHLTQVNPHLEGIMAGQASKFMLARSVAPRAMW